MSRYRIDRMPPETLDPEVDPKEARTTFLLIWGATVLFCLAALVLAVWPGVLEEVLYDIPSACLVIPVIGCWSLFLMLFAAVSMFTGPMVLKWFSAVSLTTIAGTVLLVRLHVPQRVVFGLDHGDFEELLEDAPLVGGDGEGIDRRLGVYLVDRWGRDPRGGVFFRTNTGPTGLGPDVTSYGFVHQPGDEGTPFGSSNLRLRQLFGDWYAFSVSDDF